MADAEQMNRHDSAEFSTSLVEVAPAGSFADDGLEVLAPHDRVAGGVGDDRADDAAGEIGRPEGTVAEVRSQREPVGDDRDRFGGGQRAARHLQRDALVEGGATAQLAKHGDDAADLLVGRRDLGESERVAELGDPAADDVDLLVDRRG